jgi:hypothetical protein
MYCDLVVNSLDPNPPVFQMKTIEAQMEGSLNDTLTIVAATVGIACVALLAGYPQTRRATRVDPMLALRWE